MNDENTAGRPFRLFVSAGEASGDLHTANLLRALTALDPVQLEGFGGQRMADAGVEILFDLPRMALIGFVEVAKHLPTVRRLFKLAHARWEESRPDAILLTDFPGMHLRLARIAAEMEIPVLYYISPQLWAWHESRVEQIRRTVHRMMVILPFEVDFYARHGIEVAYVGHPLLDHMPLSDEGSSPPDGVRIGLLPGSRVGEIKKMLPVMLRTAQELRSRHPEWEFVLPLASTLPEQVLRSFGLPPWLDVVRDESYATRRGLTLAWTASGTATVENALLGVPMAILYRSHPLNIFLARRLIRIPYIGLANLIAGQGVCPEFIQEQCRPDAIAGWTEEFLHNPERRAAMRNGLGIVHERLGAPGASLRAAQEIARQLQIIRSES